ncbi:MAG: replication initiation protein, partial [Turicibacter sp.]|nr:replication initiation protein [Turicibacter sp.]
FIPDYKGIGNNPEKFVIQKSNPLLTLSETSITLPELKILDVYLSRINSQESEKRYVQLEKGELEKILGVTRILQKDLDERINNLFQVVTIEDDTKRNGFTKISLFEKVTYEQDSNRIDFEKNLAIGIMSAASRSGFAICEIDIDAHHVNTNLLSKEII